MRLKYIIEGFFKRLNTLPESDYQTRLSLLEDLKQRLNQSDFESQEVVNGLTRIFEKRLWANSEFWILAAQLKPSNEYVDILCKILELEDAHAPNENIIELLTDLEDERSTAALKKAINYRFDFDQGLQIPRKALEALCSVGTKEAKNILEQISKDSDSELCEDAKIFLEET